MVRYPGNVRLQTFGSRAAVAAVVVAAACAAAATADGRESPAHDAQRENNSMEVTRDRRSKRSPSSTEPTTVVRTAAATCAGPLPDVLAATFPDTFPTLSAARRGEMDWRQSLTHVWQCVLTTLFSVTSFT